MDTQSTTGNGDQNWKQKKLSLKKKNSVTQTFCVINVIDYILEVVIKVDHEKLLSRNDAPGSVPTNAVLLTPNVSVRRKEPMQNSWNVQELLLVSFRSLQASSATTYYEHFLAQ